MKMRLLVAVVALFTLSTTSQAQIDVTVNPIGILFGNLSVGADIVISDNLSVEPTIGFGASSTDGDLVGYSSKYTSIPISVFGKYYFNPNNGADKFYASVWLRFVSRSVKYSDIDPNTLFTIADYSQTRVGGGIGVGYKIVSNGGIVFDIGFGVGRAFINNTKFDTDINEAEAITIDWPDIMFNGKLGVGYRFGG